MPVVKREQPKRGLTKEASQVFYNQMMIVLSGVEAGEPYGEIVHWYLETPVPYHGLAELIFRLEGIARLLQVPGEDSDFRSLHGRTETKGQILPEEYCRTVSSLRRTTDNFGRKLYRRGKRDMVCVELIGRKHMSLQGKIRIRQKAGEVCFRSALELMVLLSEHWSFRKTHVPGKGMFNIDEKE